MQGSGLAPGVYHYDSPIEQFHSWRQSVREDRMIYTLVLEYQGTSNFSNTGTFAQVDISLDPSLMNWTVSGLMQKL